MLSVALVRSLKQALYPAVSTLFSHAVLVEGSLKGSTGSFRSLFVDNTPFGDYVQGRLYAQPPRVIARRRVFIPSLRRLLRQPDLCDLCVARLPKIYDSVFRSLADYRTTDGVAQIIETAGTWDEVRSKFAKKKRQITNSFEEKSGLGCRMSHDPADFEHFYHRMFVPHITRRYGEQASIDAHGEMLKFFRRGLLLFVTKGGTDVAGALSLVEGNVLRFRRTGVLDGDESLVDGGAQTALYYFQLKYANENGLRAVDTMLSAPFLNDGVFRHKREWGAAVSPDDEADAWVYLFKASPSPELARLFQHNPTIVYTDAGLEGVVGTDDTALAPGPQADALVRPYRMAGLNRFVVITPERALKIAE